MSFMFGYGFAFGASGGGVAVPGWAADLDMAWDFTTGTLYGDAVMPSNTDSADFLAPNAAGVWAPLTRNSAGLWNSKTTTNEIRNSTMVGAALPSTLPTNWTHNNGAGVTKTIVGLGAVNGLAYVDIRLQGTGADANSYQTNFEATTQITAANGEVWTESAFLALVGGSLANLSWLSFDIAERTGAGGYIKGNNGADLRSLVGAELQRFSHKATLSGGGTTARVQPRLHVGYSNGAVIDLTLRIALPQLEKSSGVSLPIPTTNAAKTATGLNQLIDLGSEVTDGAAGFIQFQSLDLTSEYLVELYLRADDADDRSPLFVRNPSNNTVMHRYIAGGYEDELSAGAVVPTVTTIAFAVAPGFFQLRRVGSAGQAAITTGTSPAVRYIGFNGIGDWPPNNNCGRVLRAGISFGAQDQTSFDAMFVKAELAAAA